MDAIQQIQQDLEDTAASIISRVTAPFQAFRRAVAILNEMSNLGNNIAALAEQGAEVIAESIVGATATDGTATAGELVVVPAPSVGEVTRDQQKMRNIALTGRRLRHEAASQFRVVSKSIDPDLIKTFIARDDMDLREVSIVNYGGPESWRALMLFNELTSSKLTAGQLVFIPEDPQESC